MNYNNFDVRVRLPARRPLNGVRRRISPEKSSRIRAKNSIRLTNAWGDLLGWLPALGPVLAVLPGAQVFLAKSGPIQSTLVAGDQCLLRMEGLWLQLQLSGWRAAYAVLQSFPTSDRRTLQFFDALGRPALKVLLRQDSDHAVYESLLIRHASSDQPSAAFFAGAGLSPDVPSVSICENCRAKGFRAHPVPRCRIEQAFALAASPGFPLSLDLGAGRVALTPARCDRRASTKGPWLQFLAGDFHLHLWKERLGSAWIVSGEEKVGPVPSLALFDRHGVLLVSFRCSAAAGSPACGAWADGLKRLTGCWFSRRA